MHMPSCSVIFPAPDLAWLRPGTGAHDLSGLDKSGQTSCPPASSLECTPHPSREAREFHHFFCDK